MKAFIIKERCPAEKRMCQPMAQCPANAILWLEDEKEPLGCRMEIEPDKCDGCGICVPLCCGNCIELR